MAKTPSRAKGSKKNVFSDIGFEHEEAHNLQIRSLLMIELDEYIKANKLTQKQAAKLFGVDQPRVSDLVRGHIDKFTIDALVNMLIRAGMELTVEVRKAA